MKFKCVLLIAMVVLVPALFAEDDVVLKAMKDEMARSAADLKLPDLDRPYFISYRMLDTNSTWIGATLGSLTRSSAQKSRVLSVDVRVGDYALDNTNFVSSRQMGQRMANLMSGTRNVTVDDDYAQLRRALWLATDSEYKKSAEEFAAKRSVLQHRKDASDLADFTKQDPVQVAESAAELKLDVKELEKLARELSAIFASTPEVFQLRRTDPPSRSIHALRE
jgi:TldD protein